MELAQCLLLDETALLKLPNDKRPVFIYEWLRFLDKVLPAANKNDIKEKQEHILKILLNQFEKNPGPPTRNLLARNLGSLFCVGDTYSLHLAISTCNDFVKSKDDSPSYLPTRLAAIATLGEIYHRLGRMVGRSYEETISVLLRGMKQAESQTRCQTMLTLQHVVIGLGSAGISSHKDIIKATKTCIQDRSMVVRSAACKCLFALIDNSANLQTIDVDNTINSCLKALEDSNYDVRCEMGKVLGYLLSKTQSQNQQSVGNAKGNKTMSLDDVFGYFGQGFAKSSSGLFKPMSPDATKSNGSLNSEVRVGVTHAIVEFAKYMGTIWLERNLAIFIGKVLGLMVYLKSSSTHVETVYARKCINFILRSVINLLLSDGGQMMAGKELCSVINHTMSTLKTIPKPNSSTDIGSEDVGKVYVNSTNDNSHHVLICALQELSCLSQSLNTASVVFLDSPANLIDSIMPVLLHPNISAQLSAAFCLRCLVEAIPSKLLTVLDKCLEKLEAYKSCPEAVIGYSYAVSAVLASIEIVTQPIFEKGQQIFLKAEEMLRTINQLNPRLVIARTQAAWLLLASCSNLGNSFIKAHLPKLLLIWRNAFPKTSQDIDNEKQRGDAFTWQISFESKSGALCSIQCFVEQCGQELLTEDVLRRLLPIIDSSLSIMSHMPNIYRSFGVQLKASATMLRYRLYNLLLQLPSEAYNSTYNVLLRELVADFTLVENSANTSTSLLRSMCHVDDSVILGSWLQETDHKEIEDQLQPNSANGSGALEHDPAAIFMSSTAICKTKGIVAYPAPLPLGVAVIDSSVQLFGLLFPKIQSKHRLQILEHFSECIRQAKSIRQQVTQINIFTAVLCAMKRLAETKSSFGVEHQLKKEAVSLIFGSLVNQNPILRCAAGECLGRMAQVIGDSNFIAEMAQYSFERLKADRDVISRTGYSLALGCLHRYVGSLGSGQHLSKSVGILLALAQDVNSPVVQVWSLHALALIADSGGPLFRDYLELTMNLVLSLLLQTPPSLTDIHQCLGKVLGALITTLGPELQSHSPTIVSLRTSCTVSCSILQGHPDSLVQAESVSCYQQLHMFAPRDINLSSFIPYLYDGLSSPHLLLRRAVVACLRQLSQKENPTEISEAISLILKDGLSTVTNGSNKMPINISTAKSAKGTSSDLTMADVLHVAFQSHGLEGTLFQLLDVEQDGKLISGLEDTIHCLLQSQGEEQLSRWLSLLKEVIQAGKAESSEGKSGNNAFSQLDSSEKDDIEDDDIKFSASKEEKVKAFNGCRWPIKVFASECFRKLLNMCSTSRERNRHFDLSIARSFRQSTSRTDCLILHLSDLISFSFIASTVEIDRLRIVGLGALQDIIYLFSKVSDPEFKDHIILEQYQAQVGAALGPAFSSGTAAEVTAAACEVCSTWIGSGVARDLTDLRRVHQLLLNCLDKLQSQDSRKILSSIEGLAVLRAWAEIYIIAMSKPDMKDLITFVEPVLGSLSNHWWQTLHSYAVLSLPSDLSEALQQKNSGHPHSLFPAVEVDHKQQYDSHWPVILYSVSLWLLEHSTQNTLESRVFLILGLSMDAMCGLVSKQPDDAIMYCLKACNTLLSKQYIRSLIAQTTSIPVELFNVIHRVFLTRDCTDIHLESLSLLSLVVDVIREHQGHSNVGNNIDSPDSTDSKPINRLTKSGVFACLEVIVCGLTRYVPHLLDDHSINNVDVSTHNKTVLPLVKPTDNVKSMHVIGQLTGTISLLLRLIDKEFMNILLPSILHLSTRLIQLEIFSEEQDRPGLERTKCLNDTSPWNNKLQEYLSDVIVSLYVSFNDFTDVDSELYMLISNSLLILLLNKQAQTSVVPIYLISSILRKLTSQILLCNKSLQLKIVECCQLLWHKTSDAQKIPLVQSVTNFVSIRNDGLMKFFIRNLSDLVIDWLFKLPSKITDSNEFTSDSVRLFCICADYAEMLVESVQSSQKSSIIQSLLPLFILLLLPEDSYQNSNPNKSLLHKHSLQRINSIAPRYVSEFRNFLNEPVMNNFKSRLEAAAKHAAVSNQSEEIHNSISSNRNLVSDGNKAPKIALRIDFSNFNK